MEWSNEKVMEFLEVFQTEPCLWDHREKAHKNRCAQNDAWRRIVQALPFPVTVEDLKKKKESLMGYYRIHSNRYKKSLTPSEGTNDIYTTNWFAFDIMHSFLKPVYEGNSTLNSEVEISEDGSEEITEHRSRTFAANRENDYQIRIESRDDDEFLIKPPTRFTCSRPPQFDEFQIFGEFVAGELRNLRTRENQNKLKRMIQRAILEISEIDDDETPFQPNKRRLGNS